MSSYKPKNTRTKLDWFIDNNLKQTFDSYTHAAEIFKKDFNENISESTIRNLLNNKKFDTKKHSIFRKIQIFKDNILLKTFNTNVEFMKFYNLASLPYTCNIINGKYKSKIFKDCEIKIIIDIPDIRLHIYDESNIYQICSFCEESKLFTEQYFCYINKEKKILSIKCKDCYYKRIGNKYIDKFIENLKNENINWKEHPEFKNLYFERDTTNIFNIETGKYIICNPVINNKEFLSRNLKWETFCGKIPEHKIIKYKNLNIKYLNNNGIELDNLECGYIYCGNCEKIVENTNKKYCSKNCQNIISNNKEKNNRNTNLEFYISHVLSVQKNTNKKYKTVINYDKNHLLSLKVNCFYCNITCKYGYEKENNHPDTLSFDKKNPDIGYIKENVVVCCWFCNRMKNQTSYTDWEQFINFIKNKNNILDLSNKQFAKKSSEMNITNIYYHIKNKSPNYYNNIQDSKQTFINLCQTQKYLDPFFNFFPIICLGTNCLFNASIDAIDATLPEEEKHKPDNLQIIPKCFNYGKSILLNEQFLEEWKKRDFKTDFTNCSIKLPEQYFIESYFNKFVKK